MFSSKGLEAQMECGQMTRKSPRKKKKKTQGRVGGRP